MRRGTFPGATGVKEEVGAGWNNTDGHSPFPSEGCVYSAAVSEATVVSVMTMGSVISTVSG